MALDLLGLIPWYILTYIGEGRRVCFGGPLLGESSSLMCRNVQQSHLLRFHREFPKPKRNALRRFLRLFLYQLFLNFPHKTIGSWGNPATHLSYRNIGSPIPTSLGVSPVLKWLKTTWCHILCNLYPGRNLILCTVRSFFRIPLIVFVFVTPPKFHTKNIVTIIHCSNQSIMWIRWRGRKAGGPTNKNRKVHIFIFWSLFCQDKRSCFPFGGAESWCPGFFDTTTILFPFLKIVGKILNFYFTMSTVSNSQ